MIGRFYYKKQMNNSETALLFTIREKNNNKIIKILNLNTNMDVRIINIDYEENKISINSYFFMNPDMIHTLELIWDGSKYHAKGTLPFLGEIDGELKVYTEETKFDLMVKELPKYKTNKVVIRTDEEINKEVENLMSKMTLQEKIGQMYQAFGTDISALGGNTAEFTTEELIAQGKVGSVISVGQNVENIFKLQKIAVEESRLRIPLFFNQDVIHGFQTIFPIPLAWSCSFNVEAIKEAVRISAVEASCTGLMYAFSPMVDIVRDPRWGRVSESAGEDPYLGAQVAKAQVQGYQGENFAEKDSMMACMKHFIGYGAAEGGRDYNTTEISDTTLRNIYAVPFKSGIEAGTASIMSSFNTINNIPVTANKKILKNLLRDELNFNGITITDMEAITELKNHGAAEDFKEAAKKTAEATVDIEMVSPHYNAYLRELVEEGSLDESIINEAVKRILTFKYKMGLMDDPFKYVRPEEIDDLIFNINHLHKSREIAKESIVLLKNKKILPINKEKKIALVGPCGNTKDLLGPWQFSEFINETVTIYKGLKEKGFDVEYVKGCEINKEIENGVQEVLELCKNSDIILLSLGESSDMSGEATSKQDINLPEVQINLAKEIKKLNKPIILILTNGRPMLLNWFEENVEGILETWFLGSEAGNAIADVISGDYNPSGKLSMSFPYNIGQIPVYYNYLNTGRPLLNEDDPNKFLSRYLDGPNNPLYPFGYGLSYADFEYSNLSLQDDSMDKEGEIIVSVTLSNISDVDGEEVVQLYIQDVFASLSRPVKELKGFKKVSLKAHETTNVTFTITNEDLKFFNEDNSYDSEKGEFRVFVGGSSDIKEYKSFQLK